jgi:hypothetical protein
LSLEALSASKLVAAAPLAKLPKFHIHAIDDLATQLAP